VDPQEVDRLHLCSVADFIKKVDLRFAGAVRAEEKVGAFKGPSWTWEGDGEFLILSDFTPIENDDGDEAFGELEVTADCQLERLLTLWRALIADNLAVWAMDPDNSTLLGPDLFVERCREVGG
jgi:hypothetical protein